MIKPPRMNTDRFLKLMRLTTSNRDGEALNAIRLANKMLKENNMQWDDIIGSGNTTRTAENESVVDNSPVHIQEIEKMLEICIKRTFSAKKLAFLGSLRKFYNERGYLTPKQLSALKSWYQKAC